MQDSQESESTSSAHLSQAVLALNAGGKETQCLRSGSFGCFGRRRLKSPSLTGEL